jgi:acid-sensing ion channel, other
MHKFDDELRSFSPKTRKCYFDDEKPLKFFKTYSKLNCELECETLKLFKKCGCVEHSMPRDNEMRICGVEDSNCWKRDTLYRCECYPSCYDIKYELIGEVVKMDSKLYEEFSTPKK